MATAFSTKVSPNRVTLCYELTAIELRCRSSASLAALLLIVPFAVPMPVPVRILFMLFAIIALVRLGLEVPGDHSIIASA